MTTKTILKLALYARGLRHLTDLGFKLFTVCLVHFLVISSINTSAITIAGKTLYRDDNGLGFAIVFLQVLAVGCAYFVVLECGESVIYGNSAYIFGRKCNRKLSSRLGHPRPMPSDAIAESGKFTNIAKMIMHFLCLEWHIFTSLADAVLADVVLLALVACVLAIILVILAAIQATYLCACRTLLRLRPSHLNEESFMSEYPTPDE